jgi:hypothetical protein
LCRILTVCTAFCCAQLQEHEFQPDVVGAKACNLAKLRERLPEWILVPRSVALPFGTFEAALADPVNADVAQQLAGIDLQLAGLANSKADGSKDAAAAAAAAAANGGANGAAAGMDGVAVSAVALLARARELVEKEMKPPAGMQQVRVNAVFCLLYRIGSGAAVYTRDAISFVTPSFDLPSQISNLYTAGAVWLVLTGGCMFYVPVCRGVSTLHDAALFVPRSSCTKDCSRQACSRAARAAAATAWKAAWTQQLMSPLPTAPQHTAASTAAATAQQQAAAAAISTSSSWHCPSMLSLGLLGIQATLIVLRGLLAGLQFAASGPPNGTIGAAPRSNHLLLIWCLAQACCLCCVACCMLQGWRGPP